MRRGRVRTCGALGCVFVAATLFAVSAWGAGPPRGWVYYAGGTGNHTKAIVGLQPSWKDHGYRQPAEINEVMLQDCKGQYVFGANKITFTHHLFSGSGRGAEVDRSGNWLHRYNHVHFHGYLNGRTAWITYQVRGCPIHRHARMTRHRPPRRIG